MPLSDTGEQRVEIDSIDDFFSDHGLNALKLLKLDIEGMEKQALLGAEKTIDKHRPYLFVEDNSEEFSHWFVKWSIEKEYEIYFFVTPYFNQENHFHFPTDVTVGASLNLFCFPKEKQLPDEARLLLDKNAGCRIFDPFQIQFYPETGETSWFPKQEEN